MEIFSHNSPEYQGMLPRIGINHGAYWYSKEIVENIIPRVATTRPWVTVNVPGRCYNHAIVFIHNNNSTSIYDWLKNYNDLILVCGVKSTVEKMTKLFPMHKVVYLPLSIDTKYVEKFKSRKKSKKEAFAGRANKKTDKLPKNCDLLENMSRDKLLTEMAKYKKIYAVGRTALEAKCLGCKIGIYDDRYPKDIWKVYDSSETAEMLQEILDATDERR